MENLTTYEFYADIYFGDSIEESAFPKRLSRATDKLNFVTNGNITEESLVKYSMQIQKAVCALCDLLYSIDDAAKTATAKDDTNVKSKSSGGESITFGDSKTLVTAVLADSSAQNKLCYDTVKEYLTGTGLLYWGI